MELQLKYGRSTQSVEIEDRRVIAQLGRREYRRIEDTAAALQKAVAYPTGPYLGEVISHGDRVLLMTVDHTRPNPSDLLWGLAQRIEDLGGKPEVMIGLGNHRTMTPEQLEAFIGTSQVHQNTSRSEDQWSLGATTSGEPIQVSPILREFDKRIVVGFIEPHYIAGFSGGRKMILPGCASNRCITHNHFLTALHGTQLGRLEGNPVHAHMLEAARRVGVDWICDAVVNPDDSIHTIACGELEAAHLQGVQAARRLYGETVPRRADIVICSAGGYPYDVDMVQAKKTLAPAMDCVKPGGVVIFLGECPNRWGASEAATDLLDPDTVLPAREQILHGLRRGEVERNWGPCSPGILFARVVYDVPARLIVVTSFGSELAGTYLEPAEDLPSALAMAEETVAKDATVIAIHDGRRAMVNGS